jgi:hypothetical protein
MTFQQLYRYKNNKRAPDILPATPIINYLTVDIFTFERQVAEEQVAEPLH